GQPLVLTTGFAGTGNAGIGLIGARGFIQRLDAGERHSLHSEWAGDTQLVLRNGGLIVEHLLVGMSGDRHIHLLLHRLSSLVKRFASQLNARLLTSLAWLCVLNPVTNKFRQPLV